MDRRQPDNLPPHLFDSHLFGTLCGFVAAFVYTCANVFLRAVNHCDPVWVSSIRAMPTVLIMGPVMALMAVRGQRVWPRPAAIAAIAVGGLAGQLGGNISFQWALGEIGVALAVPLTLGGMIVAAAIFGRVILAEPVTPRVLLALLMLLGAIAVLIIGAKAAHQSVATSEGSPLRLAVGVGAACLAGVCYSVLNVVLRYWTNRGAPLPSTLFTVSVAGALSLGSIAWLRIGTAGMAATTPTQLSLMLAAGVCNTIAFAALTKSLQLTSIVYVNALNATQATMAALAGVLIFHEALSPWLAVGVALTIAGLMFLARAHRAMREPL